MVLVLPALAGLVMLVARRSSRRFVARAFLLSLVAGVAVISATVLAGPHWPWILGSAALFLIVALSWVVARWARSTHLFSYLRLAWFAWERVVELRDAHAVYRSTRPVPPPRS